MDDRTARVRARAHAIWEEEGRPHGRHDAHWQMASSEFDRDDPAGQALDADDVLDGGDGPAGAGALAALAATAARG